MSDPWLVVVDPQRVFADPGSPWGSPMFADVVEPIRALATRHGPERTLVTRWLPTARRVGSWQAYFEAWPFADRPADDSMFGIVSELADLAPATLDAPTFGKWAEIERVTGPAPELVLAGVSTDCCVLSTALAAADAGATVRIAAAACAGSTVEDHERALAAMTLYAPQITVV